MDWVIQAGAALAAAIVLAACGGGDALPAAQAAVLPAPGAAAAAADGVRIEGCIDAPAAPMAVVQATARDGRLLGSAPADASGMFRLSVPGGQDVRLAVDSDSEAALVVRVGSLPLSIGGCLRAGA
ncbi:MAG: hypothetical protein KIT35_06040 [Piscinibacter sp.]|uniref:hypothetical protein n=1 Tax=Piscinibacter TaxID=1114981 RepID=UPI000FDE20A2|nr:MULTISPECIES: hypothetical protein [Piscinibacter]MCW5663373.1 hypothetical protein [Piscinibacter sp.]